MKEFKRSLTMNDLKEADKEKMKAEKGNDNPDSPNKKEKQNLTPPFVVDLLTQEGCEEQELIQSPSQYTAQQPILEDGNWVDGQTHPTTGFACFNHTQQKEEQISLSTGVRWERWPCRCLEK